MLSDYARTTPIFTINQPKRTIFPEKHNIRNLLIKSYDILEECLSYDELYNNEPLDLENIPFYIGDHINYYGYCNFDYNARYKLRYPKYIFISRCLLEKTVNEDISLSILLHEILHATIYDPDTYTYHEDGSTIGRHHGIWLERANKIMVKYPQISIPFNYENEELYDLGVNEDSYAETQWAYHKNDEIDTYEYVEERFISPDLHIKNFLESIGQTQLMNKR